MADIGEKNYLMSGVAQESTSSEIKDLVQNIKPGDAKESSVQEAINNASNAATQSATAVTQATNASSYANSAKSNTATNNTASATGTLSQKLSYIINQNNTQAVGLKNNREIKYASMTQSVQGTYTVLEVTGQGVLLGLRQGGWATGQAVKAVSITVDGITYTIKQNGAQASSIGLANTEMAVMDESGYIYPCVGPRSVRIENGTKIPLQSGTYSDRYVLILLDGKGLYFNSSLKITYTVAAAEGASCDVAYILY